MEKGAGTVKEVKPGTKLAKAAKKAPAEETAEESKSKWRGVEEN